MTCEKNFDYITFKKSKNKHGMLYEKCNESFSNGKFILM